MQENDYASCSKVKLATFWILNHIPHGFTYLFIKIILIMFIVSIGQWLHSRFCICHLFENVCTLFFTCYNVEYYVHFVDILFVLLCHKTYIVFFSFSKLLCVTMDVVVWEFLPFEIIALVFRWLPLSVLMRFKMVWK